jgi:ABC-type multidrug transport system fused ATPase/permease subunit
MPSIFSKIGGFFGGIKERLFPAKYEPKDLRHFAEFLTAVDRKDSSYRYVAETVDLCNESLNNLSLRDTLLKRREALKPKLEASHCYALLEDDELEYLKNMQVRVLSVSHDVNQLKHQMTGFSSAVVHIAEVEEQATKMVDEIADAEDKQRIFRHDVDLLREEKLDLEDERGRIIFLIGFLYRFSIAIAFIFAAVATVFVLLHVFFEIIILLPITIMFIITAALTAILYRTRRKLSAELKSNLNKQKRAVDLINTKSAIYVYYTKFLNYEYRKYKAANSEKLKQNIKEYEHYKHVSKRYDAIKSISKQTEEELEAFLRKKDIPVSVSAVQFSFAVDIDEQRTKHKQMLVDLETIERSLDSVDKRQDDIFNRLSKLAESPGAGVTNAIVTAYNDRAAQRVESA